MCDGSGSILSNGRTDPAFINQAVTCALETSVLNAARTFKVNDTTLRAWIEKFEDPEPKECTICGKESANRFALQKHIRKWHTGSCAIDLVIPNAELRQQVVEFAKNHSVEETTEKFNVAPAVVEKWVKMAKTELICEFCCNNFHTQAHLDKHKFMEHMSKEEQEDAEELKKQKSKPNSEGSQQNNLKAMYEAKYGKLEKDDLPRLTRRETKEEILISVDVEEVKEEAQSDDEVSVEEDEECEGEGGDVNFNDDSSEDEELFPEDDRSGSDERIEDKTPVLNEHVGNVSGLKRMCYLQTSIKHRCKAVRQ